MLAVFSKVLVIFILILVGFIANKKKILPDEARPHITNLLLYITSPCMIISSIYSKELTSSIFLSTVQVMIGAAVFFLVTSIMAYYFVKFLKYKPKADWGMYIIAITSINSGFMGFPVTKAIFGDDIFYLMVMHNILLTVYIYGFVSPILNIGGHVKPKLKDIVKSMCNICMFAVILGFVMLILSIKPPAMIDEIIQLLSDATIPISMIVVGMQLGSSDIKSILLNKYLIFTNIASMFIIPVITFLIVNQLDFLYTDVKVILIFASAFPTAVAPVAIAEQDGKNAQTLAEAVSLTTFTSLITIPLIAGFLMSYYY
ncbi:MAG: AEC family transporter [Anaerovoracaceae bacterium]